ncbi:MAG: hypothetical protein GY801_47335 [bacterium]|nr:hypothetical protein [bacterium]
MMAEQSYWQQIETYFVGKRGSALMLSPKDWPLLASWEERQVPLKVVYEGIDKAFERFEEQQGTASHRTLTSLHSCKHWIEKAWERWKEENPDDFAPDAQELFELARRRLITKLRSTRQQLQSYASKPQYLSIQQQLLKSASVIAHCLTRVEQASDDDELLRLQEEVRAEEQGLFAGLGEHLTEKERGKLSKKAEARVASHKQHMNAQVYRETVELAFLQELHDAYPLPSFL